MGLFNRKQERYQLDNVRLHEPTLDETSERMKATAIEYIVSLNKADKERFVEGVELVWQGYNNSIDKVLTRHQRALRREAGASGVDTDDELSMAFLEDDVVAPPKLVQTPTPTVTPIEVKDETK